MLEKGFAGVRCPGEEVNFGKSQELNCVPAPDLIELVQVVESHLRAIL